MRLLKQSTTYNLAVFMTDETDHVTGKTGLTLTITASKDGAAFGSISPTVTELANGWYSLALTTTHTNTVGDLAIHITSTGADPTDLIVVVRARVTDDLASQASVDVVDDFLDTEVAAIKAKTDNLPSDPADASDIASSFSTVNTKLDTIDDFLDTEVAAIKAKTDNLPSDPADASDIASSFTTVNTKLDTIDDFLDTEVAAIKAKTDALPADPADASDIASAFTTVNTKLDTIDDFLDTEVAAIKTVTDKVDDTLEDDAGTYRFTANALEEAPTGGSAPSAGDIADAVRTELAAELAFIDVAISSRASAAALAAVSAFVDTEVAAIKAKTDNLPSDPADASDVSDAIATLQAFVDTEVAAIKAKTDNLPTDPADASDIAALFATVIANIATLAGYVDTEVAAIKAKTDGLPADPADASDISASFAALTAKVDVIDDFLDTEVAAIKAKTDNLPDDPADQSLIIAATNAIMSRLGIPVGADVTADIATVLSAALAVKAKTDLLPASPAATGDIAAALVATVADSVPADGSRPSVASAAYAMYQFLTERVVSGTTVTVYKPDGTTPLMTFSLNSPTAPTSLTRAT